MERIDRELMFLGATQIEQSRGRSREDGLSTRDPDASYISKNQGVSE